MAELDINEVFRGGGRSVEFLDQINQASLVMLAETGIVPRATAAAIAKGIAQVIAQERVSGPRKSADYLDYEPRLTAVVGADASRLHSGRSRQDLASAIARMNLRDGLLKEIGALATARDKLVAVAVPPDDATLRVEGTGRGGKTIAVELKPNQLVPLVHRRARKGMALTPKVAPTALTTA